MDVTMSNAALTQDSCSDSNSSLPFASNCVSKLEDLVPSLKQIGTFLQGLTQGPSAQRQL